ncbi:MAG: PH domain-containing protein [Planctomycetes bacterium]|nr:PH domain-containing protein [Polyangiaceae bacterium]MCB9832515.1 PH domain-containing protein [Planctomycetota bacterium]
MGYIKDSLTSGERVAARAHLHWIVFWKPLFWLGVAAGLVAFGNWTGACAGVLERSSDLSRGLQGFKALIDDVAGWTIGEKWGVAALGASILVLLLSGLSLIGAFLFYWSSEFAVTNRRVLCKYGFISRTTIEVLLSKVETIRVKQGVWGRVFDYGTVIITGTGGAIDGFPRISSPMKFRHKIQEQVAESGN